MKFLDTQWLYLLIPVIGVMIFLYLNDLRRRKKLVVDLIAKKLKSELINGYSKNKAAFKNTAFTLAVVFLLVTLARPQWGHKWVEQEAKGIDVIFAIDTSKSMLAEDIRPNRLVRSKYSVLDLLEKIEGDRVGLIAFSGDAFLQCPLTHDYEAFEQALNATDVGIIQEPGTNLASAIYTAQKTYPTENAFKILVLITDGEDLEEQGLAAARLAAEKGLTIYTIGVGTAQGEIIPVPGKDGAVDYVKDEHGKVVKSKLDDTTLKSIAQATGGFYTPLGGSGSGLEKVYQEGLNTLPKQELSSSLRKTAIERFQYPLAIVIFLLCLEILTSRFSKRKLSKHMKMPVILLSLMLIQIPDSFGSAYKAHNAYEKGKFHKAAQLYKGVSQKRPEDAKIHFNLGTALYKDHKYEGAAHEFKDAIKSKDLKIQKDAFYNLGNTQYRIGELTLKANKEETKELWSDALKHYESTLKLDPKATQARDNYEFVKKKLEELEEEMQEEQEQEEENEEEEDKDEEEQQDDQKDQEEQKDQESSDDNKEQDQDQDQEEEKNKQDQEESESEQQQNQDQQQERQPQQQDQQPKQQQQPQYNQERPMSQEEARQLLEALENSEKNLPLEPVGVGVGGKRAKDW